MSGTKDIFEQIFDNIGTQILEATKKPISLNLSGKTLVEELMHPEKISSEELMLIHNLAKQELDSRRVKKPCIECKGRVIAHAAQVPSIDYGCAHCKQTGIEKYE